MLKKKFTELLGFFFPKNQFFQLVACSTCLFATSLEGEDRNCNECCGDCLPWQSMPEGFVRKKIKSYLPETANANSWHQEEIDRLREDNNELRTRLYESLLVREELYQTQKALLINLEMELARTGVLRQSLQAAVQKWESYKNKWQDHIKMESTAVQELEQYKERFKAKEREYQAGTEKLKKEITILAEALTTNQKILNDINHSLKSNEKTPNPLEGMLTLGEDIDLDELEGAENNKKSIEGEGNKNLESDEIIFISSASELEEGSLEEDRAKGEIALLDKEESMRFNLDTPKAINGTNDVQGKMVCVSFGERDRSPFYISSKKVTNQEYQSFVRAINYKRPVHWPKGHLPEDLENKSVVNVTYEDAFLYSVWLGKRLPSHDELQQAGIAGLLIDLGDEINEWTGTPEMKKGSHRLFSPESAESSLSNSSFNLHTGFRVASDSN